MSSSERVRVLVCGTGFGLMYVTAVRADPKLVLAGLMSRGSETSRRVAEELGVPLYTALDQLPPELDIACVAVGGEAGHELRLQLMKRGVHVVAEHPIYPRPLEQSLDAAEACGVRFHLNTHFELLPACDVFLEEARRRHAATPALYGEVLCATPTVFSCLDMLRLAFGTLQPFAFDPPGTWEAAARAAHPGSLPLLDMHLVAAGVPISLLVHKGAFASEGQDIPLSHRISLGFPDGNLQLASLWGPVTFSRWISSDVPADAPLGVRLDDAAALTRAPYLKTRVAAVHHVIHRLAEHVRDGGPPPPGQDREHMLEVSRCWDQIFGHFRVREPELR